MVRVLQEFFLCWETAKTQSQCERRIENYIIDDPDNILQRVHYVLDDKPRLPQMGVVLNDIILNFIRKWAICLFNSINSTC